MGLPAVRDIVIVPFPFSDLSQSKNRPALCLANAQRSEWVLGHSFVRPLKLFTAHERRIVKSVGKLTDVAFQRVVTALIALLRP